MKKTRQALFFASLLSGSMLAMELEHEVVKPQQELPSSLRWRKREIGFLLVAKHIYIVQPVSKPPVIFTDFLGGKTFKKKFE